MKRIFFWLFSACLVTAICCGQSTTALTCQHSKNPIAPRSCQLVRQAWKTSLWSTYTFPAKDFVHIIKERNSLPGLGPKEVFYSAIESFIWLFNCENIWVSLKSTSLCTGLLVMDDKQQDNEPKIDKWQLLLLCHLYVIWETVQRKEEKHPPPTCGCPHWMKFSNKTIPVKPAKLFSIWV